MPLPQQVISQLTRETPKTPGWFSGVVFFPGALLAVALAVYFGMAVVYEPYLAKNIADTESKIAQVSQSIPSGDEAGLIAYYSATVNLKSLLARHVAFSQFFAWLEKNTESNVYYSQFSVTGGNQVTLVGNARAQADIIQQIAIFESSPQVQKATVSNAGVGAGGLWQFTATLIMDPSVFAPQTQPASAAPSS